MVSNLYEAILRDFGSFFNTPLQPDSHNNCKINLNDLDISIQIEIDKYGYALIFCRLPEIQGRYRDNLIVHALKANEIYHPYTGVFGFSHKNSQLIVFLRFPAEALDRNKIEAHVPGFLRKAASWTKALKAGQMPDLNEEFAPRSAATFL